MVKRILAVILILFLLPTFMGAGVQPKEIAEKLNIIAKVDGVEIASVDVEGDEYVFLPSSADLKRLSFSFERNGQVYNSVVLSGEMGTIDVTGEFDVTKVAGLDKKHRYVISVKTSDGIRERIYVMKGNEIPTLYLESDDAEKGRTWVDTSKNNKATGTMKMVDQNGACIYDGALTQIKARGNSTFYHYPKKAYQIKLDEKTDLLKIGQKEKTWVLLAAYNDTTMMHDKFFKDLALELGMKYTPSNHWINLFYDGEYRGVYQLGEKVSVGKNGVDITDLEDAYSDLNVNYGDDEKTTEGINRFGQKYLYTAELVEPKNITGGFLIEKNHSEVDEANGFFTEQGVAFNVKGPEFAGQKAMEYISEYYQEFETAVYATDSQGNYTGYNKETGKYYYEYCDLASLVQTYLIQQLSLNVDAYASSFFFYKDVNDIMYAGPIWDMDCTAGTGWSEEIAPDRNYIPLRYLAEALGEIPHFQIAVKKYCTETFVPTVRRFLEDGQTLDQYKLMLEDNAAMNYILWPFVRIGDSTREGHLWTKSVSYNSVTRDFEEWLNIRIDILSERFKDNSEELLRLKMAEVCGRMALMTVRLVIK